MNGEPIKKLMRQAPEIRGKGINSVRAPIPGGYL